jgi:hypothetical protein
MSYGTPNLLAATDNWGAFLFYAGCCFLALLYVFFLVPETTGISVEQMDAIFQGPWFTAYRYKRPNEPEVIESVSSVQYEAIKQ